MTDLNPTMITGALRRVWRNAGTPTSGTSGTYAGSADPGDILIDTTNLKLYVNMNTAASPTWLQFFPPLITNKTGGQTLTLAEGGVIRVTTDNVYIYLPTYIGNTGLTYTIKAVAAFSAGVYLRANGTEVIDANNVHSTSAINDAISIIATAANGWNVLSKVGTWTGS